MTIREIINVLIDAPNKDKPFIVECRKDEVKDYKYEWVQMEITNIFVSQNSTGAEAHVKSEDEE